MSQIRSTTSAPHQRDVVGGGALAPAHDRHDDARGPTTTSAAATTSTKNTIAWPPTSSSAREKATKVRFTALSISSTHMNITSGLRRTSRPDGPDGEDQRGQHQVPGLGEHQLHLGQHHRAPPRRRHPRRPASAAGPSADPARRPRRRRARPRRRRLGLELVEGRAVGELVQVDRLAGGSTGQHHGADHGDGEQHRGDLEGEHVVGEQHLAEAVDVGHVGVERRERPTGVAGDRRRRSTAARSGCSPRMATPVTTAAGPLPQRWARRSSVSARSTPSSMITNRNSMTMAPA